jgi:hypothetical protein
MTSLPPPHMTALPNLAAEALTSYTTFWEWFSRHERLFFQIVKEHARVEEDFFAVLSPALDAVKPGFYFQTGMFDEYTVELQISAEGVIENIVFVEDLIRAAPTIPGWLFTAHKTASDIEHTTITMAGYEFNTDTLTFYPQDDAAYPDLIDVVVVHRDWIEENDSTIQNGVLIFLDNYLGELDFATTIDRITVVGEAEAQHERVPIEKLQAYLRWRQKEFVEKYEGLRHDTENDTYAGFEAELESGNQLLAVINTDLLDWDGKASHPWVIVVTIAYDGTTRNGMPDQATYERLNELEDAIIAELPDFDGYLNVGRQTAESTREIYFACQDFRKPSKVLYQLQAAYEGILDVTYEIYKDKYWQSFERFNPNS